MSLTHYHIKSFIKTTEKAAIGASLFKGKGDKIAADQAAVDKMRIELNNINMKEFKNDKFQTTLFKLHF